MAEQYYTKKPTSPLKPKQLSVLVRGQRLQLQTGSGVFSKNHLDLGTTALLEHMQLPESGIVLDLGCGIGIVGITVKRMRAALTVCMSDVNSRAVSLAKQNCAANAVSAEVRAGDGFATWPDTKFTAVLLNPPQHAGKEVCFRLMQGAHAHLVIGGNLQVVMRRNKGGESYAAEMERIFGNVREVGKRKGFGVYVSVKS